MRPTVSRLGSRSQRTLGVLIAATSLTIGASRRAVLSPGFHVHLASRCTYRQSVALDPPLYARGLTTMKDGGKGERIDKLLSNRGVGSRTQVGKLIRKGRVSAEGVGVIKDPASRLSPTTVLYVDEDEIRPLPLLLAYNKPVGVHSTMGDPVGRMSLEDVIPARFASQFHPVGRLDADTSGLLLFSADGQLTHRLLHPKTGVDREYQATVEGEIDEGKLRAAFEQGVETAGRRKVAMLTNMMCLLINLAEGVHVANLLGVTGQEVRLSVQEGKYRMVRRMLANCGHPVVTLHRLKYGMVALGDLPEGEFREIFEDEPEAVWATKLLK